VIAEGLELLAEHVETLGAHIDSLSKAGRRRGLTVLATALLLLPCGHAPDGIARSANSTGELSRRQQ
jgi:hypothetical protein